MLAGDTVAAQLKAMGEGEVTAGKPAQAREKSAAAQKAAKPKAESAEDDEDEDEAEHKEESDRDKPVLPEDESETDDDDADGGEGGEDPEVLAKKAKALERDNFKTRERNRELKAKLDEKEARIAELERQTKEGGGQPQGGLPAGFERARTVADVEALEQHWQRELEWAEDHEDDGFTGKTESGEEFERTPAQVRAYRRQVERTLKGAEAARKVFTTRAERETKAKEKVAKRYSFVLNSESPRKALLEEIEKEHPEISTSPDRLLLLGRLAVARLVEDGVYDLTSKVKSSGSRPARTESTPPPPPPVKRTVQRARQEEAGDDWAMSLARASMQSAQQ